MPASRLHGIASRQQTSKPARHQSGLLSGTTRPAAHSSRNHPTASLIGMPVLADRTLTRRCRSADSRTVIFFSGPSAGLAVAPSEMTFSAMLGSGALRGRAPHDSGIDELQNAGSQLTDFAGSSAAGFKLAHGAAGHG